MSKLYIPLCVHNNVIRRQAKSLCWECPNFATFSIPARMRGGEREFYCSEAHKHKAEVRREQQKNTKTHASRVPSASTWNYSTEVT